MWDLDLWRCVGEKGREEERGGGGKDEGWIEEEGKKEGREGGSKREGEEGRMKDGSSSHYGLAVAMHGLR